MSISWENKSVPVDQQNWAEIPGFEQYLVSDLGNVLNLRSERYLKVSFNQTSVAYVSLSDENKKFHSKSLALLVATAFIPNDDEYFDTPIILDDNVVHCHATNLMWRPRWFAIKYRRQFRSPGSWAAPRVREVETGEEFDTVREVAMRYGVLEAEVVLSMVNGTLVWPTWQQFEGIV